MHPLLKELERDNDPHDVLEIAPDVVLAARADKEPHTFAPEIMTRPSGPPIHVTSSGSSAATAPSLDTNFRATDVDSHHVPGGRPSTVRWATRLFVGIVFAMGSAAAAAAWQHYGDTTKAMIAEWASPLFTTSSPPANPVPSAQAAAPDVQPAAPFASDVQPAAAATAPAQPAPAAPSTESATASAPDQAQALQSMAQQIEQLKASVEQLKAGQEQMSRDIAKASEAKASEVKASETRASLPSPPPRIAAPRNAAPPRAAAPPARKPRSTYSAVQYAPPPAPLPAAAAPYVPPQPASPPEATVETDGNPVVRPPMPLR